MARQEKVNSHSLCTPDNKPKRCCLVFILSSQSERNGSGARHCAVAFGHHDVAGSRPFLNTWESFSDAVIPSVKCAHLLTCFLQASAFRAVNDNEELMHTQCLPSLLYLISKG